jgi:II/X family phage/plasmid replication protein
MWVLFGTKHFGTSINAIDINYSVDYGNEHIGGQVINFLSNVSDGQVRATRNINSETCYWNKSSKIDGKQVNFGQLVERKAYCKYPELLYYVKKVQQMNLPKDVIQNIVKINTGSKLLDYAKTKLRWEAKIKAKYLKNQHGTNLVADIIQIQKEYKRAGKSLTIELFDYAFKRIFKAIGDNKMIIKDYKNIKIKLADKGFKTREVNEAVKMYGLFTYFGWHEAKTMYSKPSFYRHLKILTSVISKAQLQNLNSQYDGNVIPMMNFVELNFDNQYPDWYKEPTLESLGLTDFANRIYENKPILRVV